MATSTTSQMASAAAAPRTRDVRMSVARFVVIVGLAIQVLGIAYAIFVQVGPAQWMGDIRQGNGTIIAGTVVFLGCLALFYPLIRSRRWALVLTVLVLALLLPAALPPLAFDFPRPANFSVWILTTTITLSAVVGIAFGVVALLEVFGKLTAAPFRVAGGIVGQGVVAVALAAVWIGMVILAYAVARNPSSGATFGEAPEVMLRAPIASMRFQADTLDLRAGQPTAIFLTNNDTVPHSFEVDALNIHVNVPAGTTAVAVVKAPSAGAIPFYCAVPGHKEAGMVGTLNVR